MKAHLIIFLTTLVCASGGPALAERACPDLFQPTAPALSTHSPVADIINIETSVHLFDSAGDEKEFKLNEAERRAISEAALPDREAGARAAEEAVRLLARRIPLNSVLQIYFRDAQSFVRLSAVLKGDGEWSFGDTSETAVLPATDRHYSDAPLQPVERQALEANGELNPAQRLAIHLRAIRSAMLSRSEFFALLAGVGPLQQVIPDEVGGAQLREIVLRSTGTSYDLATGFTGNLNRDSGDLTPNTQTNIKFLRAVTMLEQRGLVFGSPLFYRGGILYSRRGPTPPRAMRASAPYDLEAMFYETLERYGARFDGHDWSPPAVPN